MRLRNLGGRYGDMVNTALKKLGSLSRKANPGSFPIRTDMGVRRSRAPRCGKDIFTRTASDMEFFGQRQKTWPWHGSLSENEGNIASRLLLADCVDSETA